MYYQCLGLQITDRCTAQCDMCMFGCSPAKSELLSKDRVKDIMKNIKNNARFQYINITGGEPFLYLDYLFDIAKTAKELSLQVSIYTNAYWCTNYEDTKRVVMDLKDAGVMSLRTSIDSQHCKFISLDKFDNLIRAVREAGIDLYVNSGYLKSTYKDTMEILNRFKKQIPEEDVEIFPFLPIEAASKNYRTDDFDNKCSIDNLQCKRNTILPILSDGAVYWCCSCICTPSVGNIYEEDFEAIYQKIKNNPLNYMMWRKKHKWLIETIKKYHLVELKENYISGCDFCNQVFSEQEVYEQLLFYAEKEASTLYARRFP